MKCWQEIYKNGKKVYLIEKTNDFEIEIPIFEQGTKQQKANKPAIEDVCDYFLNDSILKENTMRLLEFSRELKMNPVWIQKNGFKCSYKGKSVISYKFGKDDIHICVYLAEKDDLHDVVLALPDNLKTEFLKDRNLTHCQVCSAASCGFGVKVESSDKEYHFCSRFNYMCKNPTPEQFKMIEQFIGIRRNYIDSTKPENKK